MSESHRSFAVTHRPRVGVTDDDIKRFSAWVKKQTDYHFIITEKTGSDRHIHAALLLKKKKSRSNLATDLLRLFKDLDVEERSVLRAGIKSMYNNDFISSYMEKDDDTVVISRNLPEVSTLDSYFSEVPNAKKRGPQATDPFYANLEKLWWEYKRPIEETNPVNLRHFLMNMMNKERRIRVISDNRKIFQISCALSRYINQETSFNVDPDPFHQDV